MPRSSRLERWTVRAFFSVDVVNSTAVKAQAADVVAPAWLPWFTGLYDDLPDYLATAYGDLPPAARDLLPPAHRLQVWKCVGDEILFWVRLSKQTQVLPHVMAVKILIARYGAFLAQKDPRLNLRATGWLAGFPVTNHRVAAPAGAKSRRVPDFLGPSIDVGFRLTHLATQRRFVLSVELALMLLDALDVTGDCGGRFCLFCDGSQPLPGVLGGVEYPVCWLCTRDGEPTAADRLRGWSGLSQHPELAEMLRGYIDATDGLRQVFIVGGDDPLYGTGVPPEMRAARRNLKQLLQREAAAPDLGETDTEPPAEAPQDLPEVES